MITLQEIQELKKAVQNKTFDDLIEKWESEIFVRESSKRGVRSFEVKNINQTISKVVIGKEVIKDYAIHKDAFGGNFYLLTHVSTSIKILSGKKNKLNIAVKKLSEWEGLPEFTNAVEQHGLKALAHLPEKLVTEYRDIYNSVGN